MEPETACAPAGAGPTRASSVNSPLAGGAFGVDVSLKRPRKRVAVGGNLHVRATDVAPFGLFECCDGLVVDHLDDEADR